MYLLLSTHTLSSLDSAELHERYVSTYLQQTTWRNLWNLNTQSNWRADTPEKDDESCQRSPWRVENCIPSSECTEWIFGTVVAAATSWSSSPDLRIEFQTICDDFTNSPVTDDHPWYRHIVECRWKATRRGMAKRGEEERPKLFREDPGRSCTWRGIGKQFIFDSIALVQF